jgi:hypothetical protein
MTRRTISNTIAAVNWPDDWPTGDMLLFTQYTLYIHILTRALPYSIDHLLVTATITYYILWVILSAFIIAPITVVFLFNCSCCVLNKLRMSEGREGGRELREDGGGSGKWEVGR